MIAAGKLRDRVAFDSEQISDDGHGGKTREWIEQCVRSAEFRYLHGVEAKRFGATTGTATIKVCIRACPVTRQITTGWRMRDIRRGIVFNIREVDSLTDRDAIWIIVENGVAI